MNDPLFGNKLAAALLTAALIFFGLPHLATAISGGHGGGHHGELELAYPIEFETSGGSVVEEVQVDLGTLMAASTVAGGERRAALCKSCHTFDEGGANGTGPNLWNVVNRPVGGVAGFNYSGALKGFGGAWTYERLDKYLENSQAYIPGTAMVQRFSKETQRADLLAYLGSLSDVPVDYPAPAPTPAAVETEAEEVAEEAPAEH